MCAGTTTDDVPELVPARMVNEHAYCPRLFFLEWVQQRWEDNPDTVEGRDVHRRVDKPGGQAPGPDDDEELRVVRSLQLSSPDLGLVATVDLVEGDGGAVRPVEMKRGHPPEVPERAWEPERVQLCAQGLLLRDAGYRCEEGVLYFSGARQRVRVPFDEALEARTMEVLAELRRTAAQDLPPPPLVDSPKCPRCSLVGICLPDETNALAARNEQPPRRLVPRDPSARPLYISEHGAYLRKRGGRIEVHRDDQVLETIRLIDVSQVCMFGNVQVSSQLLRELFARDVPVCWFSYGGWFQGMAVGLPAKHVDLRRRQVALAHQGGLAISRALVAGKIRNSRTLLRRNTREPVPELLASLKTQADSAHEADSLASLRGIEGAAARLYFSGFVGMLDRGDQLPGHAFSFAGRNRRPPRDPINCLLSYLYMLLVKDLTALSHIVGFDPYLGFYHQPRFGRPALALDMAEEFRPLISESVVVSLINNREIGPGDFVVRAAGVNLTKDGRRRVLRAYERRLETEIRHPHFGYRITYRRVLEVQLRLLAAHVLGEISEYPPFTTR